MYNKEITKLINENFRLYSSASACYKTFMITNDQNLIDKAFDIQEQIVENNEKIERLRGEN